nr:murein biosynthesis integral membrane protein MurJ [uncultured Butyrivibrio sp.]
MFDKNNSGSILRVTFFVAMISICSKILGFFRETIIAAYFGATASTDAFFFAHSMPEMIFPSVCSGMSTAFISLYVKKLEMDVDDGNEYASRVLRFSVFVGIVLSVVGVLISPIIVRIFAPGFDEKQIKLATNLTVMSMAAFILIMLQYMITSILNSNKCFVSPQVVALFYNIVIISLTMLLGERQSLYILGLTFIIGQCVYVLGLFFLLYSGGISISFKIRPHKEEIVELLSIMGPILLGNAVIQINSIVDKVLGSLLPSGSLSGLSYSHTLCNIITGVFISSLSTVLYPTFTSIISQNDYERLAMTIEKYIIILNVITIPISIFFMFNSLEIVSVIYQRKNFDQNAVNLTAYALMCYAPMFSFYGVREVLSRAFFAMQDTKTPMINTSIGVLINIVCSVSLIRLIGIGGIAIGTSVSSAITCFLLFINICGREKRIDYIRIIKKIVLLMIIGIVTVSIEFLLGYITFSSNMLKVIIGGIVCFTVYFGLVVIVNADIRSVILIKIRQLAKKS